MGCAASNQRAAVSHSRVSLAMPNKDMDTSNKSASTSPTTNKTNRTNTASGEDCEEPPRTSNIQANDRASLAAALEDFEDQEESDHTATTRTAESAVICIMRSDKLAFSGHGIRRHSRRKRLRQKGKDDTRIIVLRKPARRDTTMMKVDERIPTKELKEMRKKAIAAAEKERKAAKYSAKKSSKKAKPTEATKTPERNSIYKSRKLVTTPLRAVRKKNRKSSVDISDIMMVDDVSREDILSMSLSMSFSSRDFLQAQ